MPEEQNQAPEAAPAATPAPQVPATPLPAEAAKTAPQAKGKSNGCLIAVIIVVVILVLIGGGIYMAYRYVKSKVNIDTNSSTVSIGDSTVSTSNTGDTYGTVTEQTLTQDLAKSIDSSIKPIVTKLFGGAKIKSWVAYDTNSGSIGYTTKNAVTSALIVNLPTELGSAGYTVSSNISEQDGAVISAIKGTDTVMIYLNTKDSANDVTVSFSRSTDTSSE